MNLLIYCAGGFGREVMDIARRLNRAHARWETIAFLDDAREETEYYGPRVLQLEDACARFGANAVEAVIATGEPFVRKALREAGGGWRRACNTGGCERSDLGDSHHRSRRDCLSRQLCIEHGDAGQQHGNHRRLDHRP